MLDAKGEIVNGLGQSTMEVPTLFPLPLSLCWGYLCVAASRLGCMQASWLPLCHTTSRHNRPRVVFVAHPSAGGTSAWPPPASAACRRVGYLCVTPPAGTTAPG
eukprot:2452401-Pyramimonas_sp.AAC.1